MLIASDILMRNTYYLSIFFLFSLIHISCAATPSPDASDKNSSDSAVASDECPSGYIKYRDKCVKDCDEKLYPLAFIPDANRGEIESCEGITTRYRYKSCHEDQGWFWDDTETECSPVPCNGYFLSKNELDEKVGTYESCTFYGKELYKYVSCNSGWDGPENGRCLEHECSPGEYPYFSKSEAEAVCTDEPSECQEGESQKKYGCNGKCKNNYYYSEGFCFLHECDEMYPYNHEEEAAGCQKLRICSSESLITVFGCDSEFGCKKGYHPDKYRCLPNICEGFPSETSEIPNCTRLESCLQGSDNLYKCVACQQGYEAVDGLCREISAEQKDSNELTCHTGDIYYSDNTCDANSLEGKTPVGIVVDPNHHLIVALSSEPKRWDSFDSRKGYDIPGITNIPIYSDTSWEKSVEAASENLNGEYNSDKFIEYERQRHVRFPAVEYCNNKRTGGKKWFIPSAGELLLFERNNTAINNALLKIRPDKNLLNHYFWSSTEASLPCSEDDECYNPTKITFVPKPQHLFALKPVKAAQEDSEDAAPEHILTYIGKYFTDAPIDGVYTLCFADYEKNDVREEDNNCSDYPFYNEESESIYTNINEMYTSGRVQKASVLEACTDSYGTWYKPIECLKGFTLDEYGCYPTDCSIYRDAPKSPDIEGCRHYVTCETDQVTYYMCDLCEKPYELTNHYTCQIR